MNHLKIYHNFRTEKVDVRNRFWAENDYKENFSKECLFLLLGKMMGNTRRMGVYIEKLEARIKKLEK